MQLGITHSGRSVGVGGNQHTLFHSALVEEGVGGVVDGPVLLFDGEYAYRQAGIFSKCPDET